MRVETEEAEEAVTEVRGVRRKRSEPVERVALRWPEEVAAALGVSRTWLYESGFQVEVRFIRRGKVKLVLVRELERVLERLSARWDE